MARITHEEADRFSSGSNSDWFQLKNDRDVARVQFMHDSIDDIEVYSVHRVMVGEKERYVNCLRTYDDPIDMCPFCASGMFVEPVRYVVMFQHDDERVKIWQRGKQFISKLQGLMDRYQPFSQHVFEIERHGVAGDKQTKYEIYSMDRVDPYDLSEVEYPQILGGIILDKTAEEMEIFLDTGQFPDTDQNFGSSNPPVRRVAATTSRTAASSPSRAATPRSTPTTDQPTSRRAAPVPSRTSESPQTRNVMQSPVTRRGSVRSSDQEVF